MFTSPTFWIVLIAILLVLTYILSNYNLSKKTKDDSSSSESTTSESTTTTSESTTTESSCGYSMGDELSIPTHVKDPDHRPPYFYKSAQQSKGETECKAALLRIYGVPFYTVRPDWLRNKRNMELDCYNESLKSEKYPGGIAVEYQGEQHYDVVKKYHPNGKADLKKQQFRDQLKRELCRRHGVYLIEVDCRKIKLDQIEGFLRYHSPGAVEIRNRVKNL